MSNQQAAGMRHRRTARAERTRAGSAPRGSASPLPAIRRSGSLGNGGWALLLLPLTLLIVAVAWQTHGATPRQAAGNEVPAVDPRLIVRPQTITQAATAGGLDLSLTASPLLPGTNHLLLKLEDHGRAVGAAQVSMTATMPGMGMRPVEFVMRELAGGRYEAGGPLSMFGTWQVTAQISRPHAPPLTHTFTVGLNLPPGLFHLREATK